MPRFYLAALTAKFANVINMLLKIQADEALDSFISRNKLFLKNKFEVEDPFKSLQGDVWSIKDLILVADLMSWHHFSGFIKLVQLHTIYFSHHLVVDDVEYMLLRHKFLEKSKCEFGYVTNGKDVAICLECVKSDIQLLGYSYWRRSHQDGISVCAKHNVKLLKNCPFCGLAFRAENHCLYILWSGCKCGRHILESEIKFNECRLELKRSKLHASILNYDRKFDCVIIYESFLTAMSCNERYEGLWNEVIESSYENILFPWANFSSFEEAISYLKFGPEHLRLMFYTVIALMFMLFKDFEEFIDYFKCILAKKSLQFESVTEIRVSIDG